MRKKMHQRRSIGKVGVLLICGLLKCVPFEAAILPSLERDEGVGPDSGQPPLVGHQRGYATFPVAVSPLPGRDHQTGPAISRLSLMAAKYLN